MRHTAIMRIAAVAACAAVLTGCDDLRNADSGEDPMKIQQQFDQLMQRPDLEEAKTHYDNVQREIRTKLKEERNLPAWEEGGGDDRSENYCSDFPDIDRFDAGNYHSTGRVAEASVVPHWDEATARMREIARKYGFEKVTIDTGSGEHRAFELSDKYGAKLYLGSKGNTVVSVSTGCHLTPKAKQRGTPVSTEESRRMRDENRESRLHDIGG